MYIAVNNTKIPTKNPSGPENVCPFIKVSKTSKPTKEYGCKILIIGLVSIEDRKLIFFKTTWAATLQAIIFWQYGLDCSELLLYYATPKNLILHFCRMQKLFYLNEQKISKPFAVDIFC